MLADKKTLLAVKSYFEKQEGWDLDEVVTTILEETKLLNRKELGGDMVSTDECRVCWGDDTPEPVCGLDDFLDSFTRVFIEKVCNVLDSFEGEDLSYYETDE
ncbi:hypothetical protein [Paenibacillus dendritiformis]|uniref:hypothetical protein n=1 Tax=Paenibacillus dendritiformis TaxID=130049 RepID=UPI00387E0AF4